MNIRLTGAIIAVTVVAIGAAVALWQPGDETPATNDTRQTSQQASMHEEYPELPEDNRFVKESAADTIRRYEEGSGVVFLGFKECPWCQEVAPIIDEAAEAEEVDIYYLDIRAAREDDTTEYQELLAILAPHLPKDESGNARISVPDISFVKDGDIFWRFEMEATTEDERTAEAYWTDERKERAIQRFRDQMKNLKEE